MCFLGIKSPQRCRSGQQFARLKRMAANGALSIPPLSEAVRVLRLQLKRWSAPLCRKKTGVLNPLGPHSAALSWVCFHAFSCLSHMFLMLAASWSCCLPQDTCRGHLWCKRSFLKELKTQWLYQDASLSLLTLPAHTPAVFHTDSHVTHQKPSRAFSQHLRREQRR